MEGIEATKCLIKLSKKYNIQTPFAKMIYQCLESKKNPSKIFKDFLQNL